ncbi:MAG: glycosyltransferase [Ignavibacteria bacterium]|nr:glycosyltransferase [Ignavibacteria bacterium]
MKLAVVSHTPHYHRNGKITGWGPTVRELDHLTGLFGSIVHIAPLHSEAAPESSLGYVSDNVKFVPLKPYGGEKLSDKLSILTTAFHNFSIIRDNIRDADWVQFRAPTAMGLYVLPYLAIKRSQRKWVKYAGNWKMDDPPLSYSLQKWMLESDLLNCKVTINGWWEGQQRHIISFPNPCLEDEELRMARECGMNKSFEGNLNICFAGTLTDNKGCGMIPEALDLMKSRDKINKITFAGGGAMLDSLKLQMKDTGVNAEFTGFVGRDVLSGIYKDSHMLLLPSRSEGFPKVIAEAAAYGCVPVVSDISSISQFFGSDAAVFLNEITPEGIAEAVDTALSDRIQLRQRSERCMQLAGNFTYSHYINLLRTEILEAGNGRS